MKETLLTRNWQASSRSSISPVRSRKSTAILTASSSSGGGASLNHADMDFLLRMPGELGERTVVPIVLSESSFRGLGKIDPLLLEPAELARRTHQDRLEQHRGAHGAHQRQRHQFAHA